jgi:hypothetical protein
MFNKDLEEMPYEEENITDFKMPNATMFTLKNT